MRHSEPINILFTSAGRRIELLRAFRRAYRELGLPGRIVATDMDPLAPAFHDCDRTYLVPRVTELSYIRTLVEICRREEIRLVFPLIDHEIPLLAISRSEIEAVGAWVVVLPAEGAATAADKWLTYLFFRRLGVPTPLTWLPEDANAGDIAYPLFIKPRFGSAGRDTFKVHDERELAFFLEYVKQPIVQEYLPGPEITNDVICDFDGNVLAVVCRQRIEVRWGEVAKAKTIYDPDIARHCVAIATGLRAIGPITVQCLLRDGKPHFTEVNPRFGGGAPLGIAAGVPSPRWFLTLAAGQPVQAPPLGTYQRGLYLTRYDDSVFLTEQEYAKLASRRV